MSNQTIDQALGAVADALLHEKKVLLTVHVNPDGDAFGCLIAMHRGLSQLGGDSAMYLSGADPVPPEYRFLKALGEVYRGSAPEDAADRTLVCLDCGNPERIGNEDLVKGAPRIINVDHHGDNTRFGDINLVVPASSTSEIVYFILRRMDVEITPEIAEALYAGILVDSGRFQYSDVTPTTFRVAADLVQSGADHTAIFRQVYENMPLAKARLLCLMLSTMTFRCDGRLAVGILDKEAFSQAGATGRLTEGLVDNLRAIEGVQVAALVYARPGETSEDGKPVFRVSLRSSSDEINVQRIAKRKNGGGHRQASGFTAEESPDEIVAFLEEQVCGDLARERDRLEHSA
ncbi:MAG: bifunctional oligoribonuclease/PAP phosphatase NrnA [Thermoleophilia bacterium]|nr:bifunctional oligoribonuclease/PAP phosphatase NrnA [Thermoleophilia bacterium]